MDGSEEACFLLMCMHGGRTDVGLLNLFCCGGSFDCCLYGLGDVFNDVAVVGVDVSGGRWWYVCVESCLYGSGCVGIL